MAPTNIFVHARLTEGGAITCVNTGQQCDAAGSAVCSVRVNTAINGSTQTASTTGTFKTYNSADCTTLLNSTDATVQISSVNVYELRP